MLDRIDGGVEEPDPNQSQREIGKGMEQRAERLVIEGMRAAKWDEDRLERERKGHAVKVRLAEQLRRETTMTLKWIAKRLRMGTWTYVSHLLRQNRLGGQNGLDAK